MNYADAYVNYYSEYRLASFDLDLHFFTRDEARALVIADKLVKDIKFVATEVQIARCNIEQQKWVEKIVLPAFHSHENCQLLSSDFENFLIFALAIIERRFARLDLYMGFLITMYKSPNPNS